jgi:hypothetical protein
LKNSSTLIVNRKSPETCMNCGSAHRHTSAFLEILATRAGWITFACLLALSMTRGAPAETRSEHVCATLELILHRETISRESTEVWSVNLRQSLKTLSPELNPDADSGCIAHSPMTGTFLAQVRDDLEELARDRSHPWVVPANVLPLPVDETLVLSIPSASFEDMETSDFPVLLEFPKGKEFRRKVRVFSELKPIDSLLLKIISADQTPPLHKSQAAFTDIAAALHVRGRSSDSSIRVSVQLGSADLAGDAGQNRTLLEMYSVAAQLRDIAERLRFTPGNPGGQGCSIGAWKQLSQTEQEFIEPFCLNVPGHGNLCTVSPVTLEMPENELLIRLTDVVLTRSISLEPEKGANSDAVEIVRKRYRARLDSDMRGRVVRSEDLGRAVYSLKMDSYVSNATPSLNGGILTFSIETRPVYKSLTFAGGVGYSAEKSGYATGSLSTENLIQHGEKLSLALAGGPHYRNANVSLQMQQALHPPLPDRLWLLGGEVSGGYSFNDKKHFGPIEDVATDKQSLVKGEVTLGFDSLSAHDVLVSTDAGNPQRKRFRHLATFTPGFEISSLHSTDVASGHKLDSGQVSALNLRPTYTFSWDLRPARCCGPGFSEFRLELASNLIKAGRWLGADFSYDTVEASGSTQITFGLQDTNQFLLRGKAGLGSASQGTPVQKQLQIGGANYIRGLERGEYLAHALVWQQVEAGVSFLSLWRWARSLRRSANTSQSPALPFDAENSYVKVFFDHGRISPATSITRAAESGAVLQGYGIAAELGRLQNRIDLTIGYGFSPQSALHKKGVVFTGFEIRF